MAELLRAADRAHAVSDLDDLSKIYPDPERSFARDNLKAIWPNYAAVPQLKVVIPSVIVDEQERDELRAAVSDARFVVCELNRTRSRPQEPRDDARAERALAAKASPFRRAYHRRTDLPRIRDFQVETHSRSTDDAAREVVEKAGWS